MASRIPIYLISNHRLEAEAVQQLLSEGSLDGVLEAATPRIEMTDAKAQLDASQVPGKVIVRAHDWGIIPLENLIASRRDRPGTLLGFASDADQAVLWRRTLESGAHGIAVDPASTEEVRTIHQALLKEGVPSMAASQAEEIRLEVVQVTAVTDGGQGLRVILDTTTQFEPGEGCLVGSTSASQLLVEAEVNANDFVATRPFRVNAGALHSYVQVGEDRTRYLSELRAGDHVLAIQRPTDSSQPVQTRSVTLGRIKVEQRPHLLVHWRHADGRIGHGVYQAAETVRIVAPTGSVAVTDLEVGTQLLAAGFQGARHFGMRIDEFLEER